jgi:lysophospholipase L1-like esterase
MPPLYVPLPTPASSGAKYVGQVATRTANLFRVVAGAAYSMVRSMHYMREDVSVVKMAFPGFYVNTVAPHAETGPGAVTAITASVEYPAGSFAQVTFSGAVTGSIPDGGMLWSDPVAIVIPRGAQFWVRTWTHCTAGGMYRGPNVEQYGAQGEAFQYAATPVTDATMGGTITTTDVLNMGNAPVAIVGLTARPSIALIGDSIVNGEQDTYSGVGDVGSLARSVGPLYAYSCLATGGDSAAGWAASNTNRAALAAYFSHSIVEYGVNDIFGGASDAALRASIASIVATLPSAQVKYLTTLLPSTTTTDAWATLVNQTVTAFESVRLSNNAWRRTVPTGFSSVFDVTTVAELTAGKWNVDGTANKWTADGIHPTPFGYQQIAASGVVQTGSMVYP